MIIVAVLVAGIIIVIVMAVNAKEAKRKETLRLLNHQLNKEMKLVAAIERATRIRILGGILHGQKCKGCSKVVPRDEMQEAGETPAGKPILLCKKCRSLIGLE